MLDDGLSTVSTQDQGDLEKRVLHIYRQAYADGFDPEDEGLLLDRALHAAYLCGGLGELPAGFVSLDASRTWIVYWVVHSLALLGQPLPAAPDRQAIIAFLATCQHPEGGFGGGPYQLAHLAPTYAAVAALVTLGGEDALSVVDRPRLQAFLMRMCVPPASGGGMTMHQGGEVDVRGCYCALAACHMLGLDTAAVGDACGMRDYIRRCQSHEGGVGGEPWNEAHGGYTFCGLAAAVLLGEPQRALDLPRLLRWAVRCQGAVEGGFMGRTAKLVDGCYSFWQGAAFPLLAAALQAAAAAGGEGAIDSTAVPTSSSGAAPTSDADLAAAAQRLSKLLLGEAGGDDDDSSGGDDDSSAGGGTLADWVASLPRLSPLTAAQRQQVALQGQVDAAVEASIEAEERYTAAAGAPAGGPLQQAALAQLEAAADLQRSLDACTAHTEALRCGAATLLAGAPKPAGQGVEGAEAERLPQLYDARALQLWLLKCCQSLPRGGLRDKPGKAADYYHSCYCLSGLASSQQYSGTVLGGPGNRLEAADPLCNVSAARLAEARRFFGGRA